MRESLRKLTLELVGSIGIVDPGKVARALFFSKFFPGNFQKKLPYSPPLRIRNYLILSHADPELFSPLVRREN